MFKYALIRNKRIIYCITQKIIFVDEILQNLLCLITVYIQKANFRLFTITFTLFTFKKHECFDILTSFENFRH